METNEKTDKFKLSVSNEKDTTVIKSQKSKLKVNFAEELVSQNDHPHTCSPLKNNKTIKINDK